MKTRCSNNCLNISPETGIKFIMCVVGEIRTETLFCYSPQIYLIVRKIEICKVITILDILLCFSCCTNQKLHFVKRYLNFVLYVKVLQWEVRSRAALLNNFIKVISRKFTLSKFTWDSANRIQLYTNECYWPNPRETFNSSLLNTPNWLSKLPRNLLTMEAFLIEIAFLK